MTENNPNQGKNDPDQSKQKGPERAAPRDPADLTARDRDRADDRGRGRGKPDTAGGAIPELDEPDVEGVGEESGTSIEGTMPRAHDEPDR